jgi:N4-gp56 family major capsid protein
MAITNFIPELWEANVQVPFEKYLVFGQPAIANRDYEGDIKQQGDTVHVTQIGSPTVRAYDKTADIETEDLTDTDNTLVINQGDYFSFRVNDIDKVQAAGDFQSPASEQAGIKLRDNVDRYIAGLFYNGALAANKLGRVTVLDAEPEYVTTGQISAYQVLVRLREKLDLQSVPTEGRYAVVPPEFVSALLLDKRYTDLSGSGSTVPLLNGQVGRSSGFDILVSNNIRTVAESGGTGTGSTTDKVVVAGVPSATSFANQLTEVEALREQKRFADQVRGLNIYGAKIFRPEGIATAAVSFAPRVFAAA